MTTNYATVRTDKTRPKPHLVTININGQRRTKAFPTKAAATKYQTRLNAAVREGEEFDPAIGQPYSWAEEAQQWASVTSIARRIVSEKWPQLRARSRKDVVEGLAHVIAATTPHRNRQTAYTLATHALRPNAELDTTDTDEWRSVKQTSPPAPSIDYTKVVETISTNLDGSTPVANTVRKRVQMLDLVVEVATGTRPKKPRSRGTKNAVTQKVSPGRIGTIPEALTIINKVQHEGKRRALLLMLYAGLRPSEAIALRWERIDLTSGKLVIAENTPSAGSAYTDSGNATDIQPPKWLTEGASRIVPILQPLQAHLAEWAQSDGNPACGLVCVTTTGTPIPTNDLSNAWRPLRQQIGAMWAKERLARPYDLRHQHASIALNAGTPIPEVAERLGHSPSELLATYAAVINTDQQRWTAVMTDAFTV